MRLEPFADILGQATGLDPASLGEGGLGRAVNAAMARAGITDPEDYRRLLATSPEALKGLVRETVVPETWFFRDAGPFRCLGERLRTLKRRGTAPRILSAPCATGEEAYSISITCLQAGLPPGGFHVAAVDVSAESLAVASRGVYGRNSFREDMAEASRYFTHRGDDDHSAVWIVRPEVAAGVTFVQANIVSERFLVHEKPFDIIFSRNLLIYLNHDARKRLLANIRRLLAPDGLLFVGHSEILSFLPEGFQPVPHPRAFACTRATPRTAASVSGSATRTVVRPRGGKTPPAPDRAAAPRSLPRSLADVSAPRTSSGRGEDDLGLARLLADRGELAAAAALCRRHLETNRRSAEAYFLLGLVGAAERRVEEARAFFQKALYLEPDHAACLTHLALIHEQLGDAARAALYRQRLRRLSETGGTRP